MTPDTSQPPEDHPPHGRRPAPDVTALRLADHWDADTWRYVVVGAALGVLSLPAVAMAVVGLLVLAVQGVATWLLVTAAALVTAALGGIGTAVALRRGHRGVVHRLALLTGVWGLLMTVAGVVVGLSPDAPERVGVAVLLVLGGTYTLVLALGLWGASRVLPAPHADAAPVEPEPAPGPSARTGATPTVSEVPTPAVAPDDDTLADWPEWGGDPVRDDARATTPEPPAPARDVAHDTTVAHDVPQDEPPAAAPRSTAPVSPRATSTSSASTSSRSTSSRSTAPRATPARSTPPRGTAARTSAAGSAAPRTTSSAAARSTGSAARPPRRSVTSADASGPVRAPSAGEATERIARQDGDDGPPTQRIPPVQP